jgi:hypothetical protein
VANTLVAGPSTRLDKRNVAFNGGSDRTEVYQRGNRIDADPRGAHAPVPGGWELFAGECVARRERFAFPQVETEEAEAAYLRVLQGAGASRVRDTADRTLIRSVTAKTGSLIDSQKQVGGWPRLRTRRPPADTDGDGMPDAWETANGLNPRDPADGATLANGGQSNLERYLDEQSRASVSSASRRGK